MHDANLPRQPGDKGPNPVRPKPGITVPKRRTEGGRTAPGARARTRDEEREKKGSAKLDSERVRAERSRGGIRKLTNMAEKEKSRVKKMATGGTTLSGKRRKAKRRWGEREDKGGRKA